MRIVEVVPYNHQWPQMFEDEASKIKTILNEIMVQIHHIGSTSIPNMSAKPVIDVLVEVHSIEKVDLYNQEMMKLGYVPKGENGILYRRYFSKGGDNRTHHVHIYQTGNPEITRHLQFRDYLTEHPEDAKLYSELKQSLSKQFPADIEQYILGKNALVKELDQKAKLWGLRNNLKHQS